MSEAVQQETVESVIDFDSEIIGFEVVQEGVKKEEVSEEKVPNLQIMGEHIKSPRVLSSTRYKVVPRGIGMDENYYVHISDITLNEGTEFEEIRPFEIFITTKDTTHIQWVNALALVLSAVMRKGGDVAFISAELQQVVDPSGGWFNPGGNGKKGKFVPSLVSAIGDVLQEHFEFIGIVEKSESISDMPAVSSLEGEPASDNAESNLGICPSCKHQALKYDGGCPSCLECGWTKCN